MADPQDEGAYEGEVERVRNCLAAEGRSQALLHLFEYLVLHSRDSRAPKEIEIAFEVFGKDDRFDTSQDAMVRVYMHRLRGRLDEIYEAAPGARLIIPKGDYRVVLQEGKAAATTPEPEIYTPRVAPMAPPDDRPSIGKLPAGSWRILALALLVATPLIWATIFYLRHNPGEQPASIAGVYKNGERRCAAITLVTGDTYLYSQSSTGDRSRRLIMRPGITSARQLDDVRKASTKGVSVSDLDDFYMSADSMEGLWSLLTSFSSSDHRGLAPPNIIPNSKLTPKTVNRGDIIYFGRLDQLGPLHDNVFQNSRFTLDPVSDTLRDSGNRRDYMAELMPPTVERDPGRPKRPVFAYDYGYLARIAKPNGCAIWIISGLEDSALPQMARIAGNPASLKALRRIVRNSQSFEALYEFRAVGPLKPTSRLLIARPMEP